MKDRCLRSNHPDWELYGGRGITVCDRWLNSFENFLVDMGRKPSPIHSIDRINNNGNYDPENCRWATPKQQAQNRRRPRCRSLRKTNTSGHVGVSWVEELGRYRAQISVGRRCYHLGCYKTIDEAIAARKLAEQRVYA